MPHIDARQELEFIKNHVKSELKRLYQDLEKTTTEDRLLKESAYEAHLEYKRGVGAADSAVVQQRLLQSHSLKQGLEKKIKAYKIALASPFFASISFAYLDNPIQKAQFDRLKESLSQMEGQQVLKVYQDFCSKYLSEEDFLSFKIGTSHIYDRQTFQDYVIDWRAPIASLYYDSTIGPATYSSPQGSQYGCLLEKKQWIISRGRLRSIVDLSSDIYDHALESILSQNSTDKMKHIVSSIQQEQNRLIRLDNQVSVFIQGIAGSGKSSIAMHRAAWLLYRNKDWSSENILLISPNEQFSEYVSELLPSLGEENLLNLTIESLALDLLAKFDPEILNFKQIPATQDKWNLVASSSFFKDFQNFCTRFPNQNFEPDDLDFNGILISKEEIATLFNSSFSEIPMFERIKDISNFLTEKYFPYSIEENRLFLTHKLQRFFNTQSIRKIYKTFLDWYFEAQDEDLVESFKQPQGLLDLLDLQLLAAMCLKFYAKPETYKVKHLIIDEAQDLCFFQHDMLASLYPASKTILSDLSQSLRFNLPQNYLKDTLAIYQSKSRIELHTLNLSYRSTKEITEFASAFFDAQSLREAIQLSSNGSDEDYQLHQAFHRSGEKPQIDKAESLEMLMDAALNFFERAKAQDYNRVALLVPNQHIKEKVAELFEMAGQKVVFNPSRKAEDTGAILILDVLAAKGMEFDAVYLWNVSKKHYHSTQHKKILYVGCTRALHLLGLSYLSEPSVFLEQAKNKFQG